MTSKFYKSCAVTQCDSTTIKTPNKLFIYVPHKPQRRRKWLQLARLPDDLSMSSKLYFCEDHFDLERDMENYMEYKIMGSVKAVRMKPDCKPTKFNCLTTKAKKKSALNASRCRIPSSTRNSALPATSYNEGYVEDSTKYPDFQCNACTEEILGYVCLQCLDFNLCSGCEAKGVHDQHYVLRIPGPRQSEEVQGVLEQIRKHLLNSLDLVNNVHTAISIKLEVKEECEDEQKYIEEQMEAKGVYNGNELMSQDEALSCQVDETESKWALQEAIKNIELTLKEDLKNTELTRKDDIKNIDMIPIEDIRNIEITSKEEIENIEANDVKPIIKQISTGNNDTTNQEQTLLNNDTSYIENQPLNVVGKTTVLSKFNQPASNINDQLVLNGTNTTVKRPQVPIDVPSNKKRIVLRKTDIERFLKMKPSVKGVSVIGICGNKVERTVGNRQPLIDRQLTSRTVIKDKDTNR